MSELASATTVVVESSTQPPSPYQVSQMRILAAQNVIDKYEHLIDTIMQTHESYETFKRELTRRVRFQFADVMHIFDLKDLETWVYGGALESLFKQIYEQNVQFLPGIFGSIWFDVSLTGGGDIKKTKLTRVSLDYEKNLAKDDNSGFIVYLDASFSSDW